MKHSTRFNPTVNGPLHLGHLYNILINLEEAHSTGGKFIFRFDDTQWSWNYYLGKDKVQQFKSGMMADLEWLGIRPDLYVSQAEIMPKVDGLLRDVFHYQPALEPFANLAGPTLAGCKHHFYPYTDRLTSEKVIMDMLDGITYLIRGVDLITEDCLYIHYCTQFNIPIPITDYLPRLDCGEGEISKTLGTYKLEDFRRVGYNPKQLIYNLAEDCLYDNGCSGWAFNSVRQSPKVGSWAKEALNGLSV